MVNSYDDDWPMSASAINEEMGVRQYKAFWNGQSCDAQGVTALDAQENAVAIFRDRNPRRNVKQWDVAVILADVPVDPASL